MGLHNNTAPTPPRMSIDVSLCGNLPRSTFLNNSRGAPCGLQALTCNDNGANSTHRLRCENLPVESIRKNIGMRPVLSERQPLAQLCEAPSWAVPAKGETRLEPVCEGSGRQMAVDLTQKSLYRVGRSPHCDIQLLHASSSRRHALIFHHSNGSCYLVDCGSAHGTYVNGVRVPSPSNGGVVVPHKVRRGAMIRFGGPGAPSFVLKSFSFKLDELVDSESSDDEKEPDMGELVRRNTRLNALGSSAVASVRGSLKFMPFDEDLAVSRKRSFDSLSTSVTLDEEFEPMCKRTRCSSPPLSPEASPLRLVSPDIVTSVKKRVRFSSEAPLCHYPALVTESEDEDN